VVLVCNLDLSSQPPNTVVERSPGTDGNVVVVSVSGQAVVVLHTSGLAAGARIPRGPLKSQPTLGNASLLAAFGRS
jgi:hypothetical protein